MTNSMPPNESLAGVFVVIAAFNEAPVIADVLEGLSHYLPLDRVVVVDDASSDDTYAQAHAAGARVLRHGINRGQGAALATGIAAALRLGAQIIVTFDADGQHDPADLAAVTEPLGAGRADIVLGTRFAGLPRAQVPPIRKLLLRAGALMTRVMSRVPVTDMHNGYRAIARHAAEKLVLRRDRMEHASEIIDNIRRHKWRFEEVPVTIRYTDYSLLKGQKNRHALGLAARILFYKVGG